MLNQLLESKVKEDHTPWIAVTGGYAKDMTLRDYFAAKAMQALIASPRSPAPVRDGQDITAEIISDLAYVTADAMLKARDAK
jgi:hypothetical protein